MPAGTETKALKALSVSELHSESCLSYVTLPLSSNAFLWASQSSSLVTVMLASGNFPCRGESSHQNQEVIEKLTFSCSSESGPGILKEEEDKDK